jgi:hypothetical protein
MELWLATATILATLDISKTRDERGNEIEPIVEFTQGAIRFVIFLLPHLSSLNLFARC